jgi:hypothetical protein
MKKLVSFPLVTVIHLLTRRLLLLWRMKLLSLGIFFICGLRFLCDTLLPAILNKFSVKIHQLTPNSFLELLKFFWIMKTFKCTTRADIFARLFELVIGKNILKLSDGNFYEADYGCCTFNTRRKNSFQHIIHIQLALCSKMNLLNDWRSY